MFVEVLFLSVKTMYYSLDLLLSPLLPYGMSSVIYAVHRSCHGSPHDPNLAN